MGKVRELVTGHASESTGSARREEQRRTERRRGPHGEELRVELKLVRTQRRTLAILNALLLLACGSLAVWAWNQQSALEANVRRKSADIKSLTEQLTAATTGLEESHRTVDSLVAGRIPGLLPFRIDEPIAVDTPFVREVSFTPAAPPISGQECKVVVENDSDSDIRPALSVLVFDEVGIQLARAQILDGLRDELRADEIRSFFANLEIPKDKDPRYFLITSD
jgi:hypothetical protein